MTRLTCGYTAATVHLMIIAAKFASTCPCCRRPIAVGSKIEWVNGSAAKHSDCGAAPARRVLTAAQREVRALHASDRGVRTDDRYGSDWGS